MLKCINNYFCNKHSSRSSLSVDILYFIFFFKCIFFVHRNCGHDIHLKVRMKGKSSVYLLIIVVCVCGGGGGQP